RQHAQTLAEGAIADLVVVLDEGDEGGRRQGRARTASRPASMARRLALIGEAFGQSPPQMARLAVILVIASRLSRRGDVKDMMDVVVPLRRIVKRFAILPNEPAG